VSAETSTMLCPPMRTAALSGRRREPSQRLQVASLMNCAYQRLALSEPVSRKRRSSLGTTPSHAMSK
jgi:hypothetical protein